jgi:hypothetical protein
MAVNWVKKTISKITGRKALERWEMKIRNCEVMPQPYCKIAHDAGQTEGTNCYSWSFRP